jgi:hypothetical protein
MMVLVMGLDMAGGKGHGTATSTPRKLSVLAATSVILLSSPPSTPSPSDRTPISRALDKLEDYDIAGTLRLQTSYSTVQVLMAPRLVPETRSFAHTSSLRWSSSSTSHEHTDAREAILRPKDFHL